MAERVYSQGELIGVLTTEPLGRVLDYRAPEGGCGTGDFVEVPLGPRRVLGVVWGDAVGGYDPAKVRAAYRRLDALPMRAHQLLQLVAYNQQIVTILLRSVM